MKDQTDKHALRTLVRGTYDLQKLRIALGNRVVGNFKAKLGQAPGEREEELDDTAKKLIADLRSRYMRITDGVVQLPTLRQFEGDEVISTYTELVLVHTYVSMESQESTHFKLFERVLKGFELWKQFLEDVKGCGPAMAGVLISEIDISKCTYPSSVWAYAGLDVAPDGRGRSRRKEHLVERAYINKDGEEATRVGITFNPFLKSKLMGVLASSFLKCKSPYSDLYYTYKNRLENSPAHKEKTLGHRHNMALRYMIKRFLVDLYIIWRSIEGLPVASEYSEGKLGIVHGKGAAA